MFANYSNFDARGDRHARDARAGSVAPRADFDFNGQDAGRKSQSPARCRRYEHRVVRSRVPGAITTRYLEAMVAHDPSRAPLSPTVKYTQDNVPLQIGDALWATASSVGTYRHFFADPERGDVGCICVLY